MRVVLQLRSARASRVSTSMAAIALCLVLSSANAVPDLSGQGRAPAPSLDRLVQRINDYWKYLEQGKKSQALAFVEPGSRDRFLTRQNPAFSDPRLVRLEPGTSRTRVTVTVEVKRIIPPQITTPVQWPVTEEWVFQGRDWFVIIPEALFPFATPASGAPPPSPSEIEQQKDTITRCVRFENSDLDFGTVRKGIPVRLSVKYQVAGDQPMALEFNDPTGSLVIHNMETWQLEPGGEKAIDMELLTDNYDGTVEQSFRFVVRYRNARVSYPFTVRGNVYSPVSAFPSVLRFARDEREKQVLVRNNSRFEVRIKSFRSESGGFRLAPLPSAIPPGETMQFRVRMVAGGYERNHREVITLIFQDPVEGMTRLRIPAIVNPMTPPANTTAPLTPEEMRKLIPKTPPPD